MDAVGCYVGSEISKQPVLELLGSSIAVTSTLVGMLDEAKYELTSTKSTDVPRYVRYGSAVLFLAIRGVRNLLVYSASQTNNPDVYSLTGITEIARTMNRNW